MKKFIVGLVVFGLVLSVFSGFNSISFAQKIPHPEQYTTPMEYTKRTGKGIDNYNEAPTLAELVKQGKLPPIKERLPKNPPVIVPLEKTGKYGGDLRVAFGLIGRDLYPALTNEPLVKWDGEKIIPNVVESWEVSRDSRVYTFYLREGLKWSDGKPFTADDIVFWYEDILLNKDLTPVFPVWLTVLGKPVKLRKINLYTVEFSFSDPYPLFLEQIAYQVASSVLFYAPAHYLKQFHPRYTPKEELDRKVKEEKLDAWYKLFWNRADVVNNPECPTLGAWRTTGPLTAKTYHFLERNPYYWKVDSIGNQLPYIDRIATFLSTDVEVIKMKIFTGEIDLDFFDLTLSDYPIIKEGAIKGGYRVFLWDTCMGSDLWLAPNLTCKDPVLRKVFNDRRFRIALSVAINREEINQLFYFGMTKPRQATVLQESPFYTEGIDKLYTEYDPDKANKLLDEIGLKWDKDHRYRLRPDNKIFEINIEYAPYTTWGPWEDMLNLVAKYWNSIGIKVSLKEISASLYQVRENANELPVSMWAWGRAIYPLVTDPGFVFPNRYPSAAPLYTLWYQSGGKQGEKPTGDILKVMTLYDQFRVTVDPEKRLELGKEIVKISAENVWCIGTVGDTPCPVVVKNNLRNVPEKVKRDWTLFFYISYTSPQTYFWEE